MLTGGVQKTHHGWLSIFSLGTRHTTGLSSSAIAVFHISSGRPLLLTANLKKMMNLHCATWTYHVSGQCTPHPLFYDFPVKCDPNSKRCFKRTQWPAVSFHVAIALARFQRFAIRSTTNGDELWWRRRILCTSFLDNTALLRSSSPILSLFVILS